MVVLVRCANNTYTVALLPRLESLASEGLITAYLGPGGWIDVETRGQWLDKYQVTSKETRYNPHWQIQHPATTHQPASP